MGNAGWPLPIHCGLAILNSLMMGFPFPSGQAAGRRLIGRSVTILATILHVNQLWAA
jgi:hypothetical protein